MVQIEYEMGKKQTSVQVDMSPENSIKANIGTAGVHSVISLRSTF